MWEQNEKLHFITNKIKRKYVKKVDNLMKRTEYDINDNLSVYKNSTCNLTNLVIPKTT